MHTINSTILGIILESSLSIKEVGLPGYKLAILQRVATFPSLRLKGQSSSDQ